MPDQAYDWCFASFASLEDALDTGQWNEAQRHAARIATTLRPRPPTSDQEPIVWLYTVNLQEALWTGNWAHVRRCAQRIVDTLSPPKAPVRSGRVIEMD